MEIKLFRTQFYFSLNISWWIIGKKCVFVNHSKQYTHSHATNKPTSGSIVQVRNVFMSIHVTLFDYWNATLIWKYVFDWILGEKKAAPAASTSSEKKDTKKAAPAKKAAEKKPAAAKPAEKKPAAAKPAEKKPAAAKAATSKASAVSGISILFLIRL